MTLDDEGREPSVGEAGRLLERHWILRFGLMASHFVLLARQQSRVFHIHGDTLLRVLGMFNVTVPWIELAKRALAAYTAAARSWVSTLPKYKDAVKLTWPQACLGVKDS